MNSVRVGYNPCCGGTSAINVVQASVLEATLARHLKQIIKPPLGHPRSTRLRSCPPLHAGLEV